MVVYFEVMPLKLSGQNIEERKPFRNNTGS